MDCENLGSANRKMGAGLCDKHWKALWRANNPERSREINRKSDTARRLDGRRKLTERKALERKWNMANEPQDITPTQVDEIRKEENQRIVKVLNEMFGCELEAQGKPCTEDHWVDVKLKYLIAYVSGGAK